jgi:hypothetical protein
MSTATTSEARLLKIPEIARRLASTATPSTARSSAPPLSEVAVAATALTELRHGARSVGVGALKSLLRRYVLAATS